jgi:hypothetical protein
MKRQIWMLTAGNKVWWCFHVDRGFERLMFIPWCCVAAFDRLCYLQTHLTSSGEIENEKWPYRHPVCVITGLQNSRKSKQNIFFNCINLVYLNLKHTEGRVLFSVSKGQTGIVNVHFTIIQMLWCSFVNLNFAWPNLQEHTHSLYLKMCRSVDNECLFLNTVDWDILHFAYENGVLLCHIYIYVPYFLNWRFYSG